MNLELLEQGLIAMCIGMGVVLTFLLILILAMNIMSKVVIWLNGIFPEKIDDTSKGKKAVSGKEEEQIAVAIAAIVART